MLPSNHHLSILHTSPGDRGSQVRVQHRMYVLSLNIYTVNGGYSVSVPRTVWRWPTNRLDAGFLAPPPVVLSAVYFCATLFYSRSSVFSQRADEFNTPYAGTPPFNNRSSSGYIAASDEVKQAADPILSSCFPVSGGALQEMP